MDAKFGPGNQRKLDTRTGNPRRTNPKQESPTLYFMSDMWQRKECGKVQSLRQSGFQQNQMHAMQVGRIGTTMEVQLQSAMAQMRNTHSQDTNACYATLSNSIRKGQGHQEGDEDFAGP